MLNLIFLELKPWNNAYIILFSIIGLVAIMFGFYYFINFHVKNYRDKRIKYNDRIWSEGSMKDDPSNKDDADGVIG